VIAEQTRKVTVFQRTANFSLPAGNRALMQDEINDLKADYDSWRHAQRYSPFGTPAEVSTTSALDVPPDERNATYQRAWDQGDLVIMLGSYSDTLTDMAANDTAAEFIRARIRDIVADPKTADALAPNSFPFGTKRPCLDTDYYATFNRPNVGLVNLRSTPLTELTEDGLRTTDREYAFDALVLATGYDAMTGALSEIDIRGRGGVTLTEEWAAGPNSYLGIGIAGFPNLFTVTGPLSPSVLSNMIVSIEQHVEWITGLIAFARRRALTDLEPTQEAQQSWAEHSAEVAAPTLYPRADSWYMGANVPGKPRFFMPYIGGVGTYRQICDDIAADGYRGFRFVSVGHRDGFSVPAQDQPGQGEAVSAADSPAAVS
jgi:cyclohexanone monooxygenase